MAKKKTAAHWGKRQEAPAKAQGDPLTGPLPVKANPKPSSQAPLKDQGDALASHSVTKKAASAKAPRAKAKVRKKNAR